MQHNRKRHHEEDSFCNRTRGRVPCLVTDKGQRRREESVRWHLGAGLRTAAPQRSTGYQDNFGRHFIFVAYDTEKGKPLYTGGGTYILNGSSYAEHIDFASDEISTGLVGKDQPFTVKVDGDTFTQTGTLSNGKGLSETWKRVN
jgi:hypothetical protein